MARADAASAMVNLRRGALDLSMLYGPDETPMPGLRDPGAPARMRAPHDCAAPEVMAAEPRNHLTPALSRLYRALIHLHRLDHDEAHLELALGALRAVADATELRRRGRRIGEYLMALEALRAPYVLLSVVGPDDAPTRALVAAARALPHPNELVEVGRPGESRYPYPGEPAVYLCNESRCSIPVTDPNALASAATRFLAPAE